MERVKNSTSGITQSAISRIDSTWISNMIKQFLKGTDTVVLNSYRESRFFSVYIGLNYILHWATFGNFILSFCYCQNKYIVKILFVIQSLSVAVKCSMIKNNMGSCRNKVTPLHEFTQTRQKSFLWSVCVAQN